VKLAEIWVKAPILNNADLLIASECLKNVNEKVWGELARGRVVLTCCPENEPQMVYGKIASIIRSSKPRSITVVTIDGSPHCFQLHAAVNEAVYILKERVKHEHYVLVDAKDLVKISPKAVRVARYLSLVEGLIKKNPWILKELEKHSLEHRVAKEIGNTED